MKQSKSVSGVDRLCYDLNAFEHSSVLSHVRGEYFRNVVDWPRNNEHAGQSLKAPKLRMAAEHNVEEHFP